MAVDFTLTDEELLDADLTALTSGMTNAEKGEWMYWYTHRAANLEGRIIKAWLAGTDNYLWYAVDWSTETKTQMKADVNSLATRIVEAQTFIDTLTE